MATLVLRNGKVWTGDPDRPLASAVAVQGSRLIAVGTEDEVAATVTESTRVIDVEGKLITPGFIDSHVHFLMGGCRLASVQLAGCSSKEDFVERIRKFALRRPKGSWICGGDWDHTQWVVPQLPTRKDIDAVTPHHPIWLNRMEGHQYLANSVALKLAGVTGATPDVEGGTIRRFEDGEPTGLLADNALQLVYPHVPKMTEREADDALEAATRYVHAYGVTSIHHMTAPQDKNLADLYAFKSAMERGRLRIRVYCATPLEQWHQLREEIEKTGREGGELLRWGAVKGFVDGSLGSHNAAFIEPYTNRDDGYCGDIMSSEEELFEWVKGADGAGLQVCVHAIGDRAVRIILDIYERVANENGPRDRRHRIEHAQHITKDDIKRFAELGVHASVQPQHAADDGRWCEEVIGKERSQNGTYPFRSLLNTGANLAGGSDWFVAPPNPIAGIASAVTRRTNAAEDTPTSRALPRPVFGPAEAITVEEALVAYTRGAARSVHEEDTKGMLRPGFLSDVVVLNKDILSCNPTEIEDTRVVLTVFDGEVVYDREAELRTADGMTEADRIERAVGASLPRCPCCHGSSNKEGAEL